MHVRFVLLGAAIAALVAGTVSPGVVAADEGSSRDDVSPAVVVRDQVRALDWAACDDADLRKAGIECARLTVPMDRSDASAGTMSLAVARHRSTGTAEERIGSLVFNPGGPGGSGLGSIGFVWADMPDAIKKRFDVVTWDPRGVGQSRPALEGCESPLPERPATGPVDWAQVARDYKADLGRANRQCQERNARIIDHLGTVEVVDDVDDLRAALGEEQISFWGMSYGTRIGYVYALRHPDGLRALLLDGSIDPAATTLAVAQGGAAPDQAYGTFADAYPEADRQLDEVLAALQTRTLDLPEGEVLTRWDVLDTVYGALIAQQVNYPTIASLTQSWFAAVLGSGDTQAQGAAASLEIKRAVEAIGNSNAGGVFSVVNCTDYAGRPTLEQATSAVRYQHRLAPAYGGTLSAMFALGCSGLTLTPDPVPVITGEGPELPALILGATRDGSTIVQWTARMSRAFPESRTVTYAGGQHVTWLFAGSECVDRVANRYLLTLRLPASDRGCPNAYRVE
jgi:pimeloyl-ACP methyl ester carboxylesterase